MHGRRCMPRRKCEGWSHLLRSVEIQDGARIAAGGHHSMVLTADGLMLTFGQGKHGRLGHGDGQDQLVPKVVDALQGVRVSQVEVWLYPAVSSCIY